MQISWQAPYTEPPGPAAARVVAAGPRLCAAACCADFAAGTGLCEPGVQILVAGAVHMSLQGQISLQPGEPGVADLVAGAGHRAGAAAACEAEAADMAAVGVPVSGCKDGGLTEGVTGVAVAPSASVVVVFSVSAAVASAGCKAVAGVEGSSWPEGCGCGCSVIFFLFPYIVLLFYTCISSPLLSFSFLHLSCSPPYLTTKKRPGM